MFESQGNTPESAQDNVEVIINSMSGAELAPIMDDLSGQVTELEAEVTRLKSELGIYRDRASDFAKTIGQARDLIQEVLAGDTEAESTFDDFRAPFELLGVSLDREVEVEITVTWRGTVTLPMGTDPEDLDIDDFGITEPLHNWHNSHFSGIHDSDISER